MTPQTIDKIVAQSRLVPGVFGRVEDGCIVEGISAAYALPTIDNGVLGEECRYIKMTGFQGITTSLKDPKQGGVAYVRSFGQEVEAMFSVNLDQGIVWVMPKGISDNYKFNLADGKYLGKRKARDIPSILERASVERRPVERRTIELR